MNKIILLFFIFLIGMRTSSANYPYYYFDETKVKISNSNFYRYIIPQSHAIIKEYYHILKKLNPLHHEIILLKNRVDLLRKIYSSRKTDCYKTAGLCNKELSNLYSEAIRLDKIILKLRVLHGKFRTKNSLKNADELLIASKKIDQLSSYIYKLIHMLEEELISLNTRFELHSNAKKKMNVLILKIMSHTHMIITSFVPPKFKQEFDFLWESYITKLEKYIIRDKNKKYLIRHLGELNISWNSFHMKLSKGNLNFPKKMLKIISIQHNRWNSILKVILRR